MNKIKCERCGVYFFSPYDLRLCESCYALEDLDYFEEYYEDWVDRL